MMRATCSTQTTDTPRSPSSPYQIYKQRSSASKLTDKEVTKEGYSQTYQLLRSSLQDSPQKGSLLEPNKDWSPLKIPQILRGWMRMNFSFGELSKARSIQYQNLKQAKVDHLKELASTCEFRSQMIAYKWNLSAGCMCCSVLAVLEVLEVLEVEVLLIAGRGAAPLVSSHDSSVSQNHFGATKTQKH